jgi:putative transposase
LQGFLTALKSYFKAVKQYKQNPSKFSGEPRPPHKEKKMYKVTFKKEAIRYKNGYLLLSLKSPYEPIRLKWNSELPIPIWIIIVFDRLEGWSVNYVLEKKNELIEANINSNVVMGIDLGIKRIATTYTPSVQETITYSGKDIMSLVRLRNKLSATSASKRSKCKKDSRRYKNITRAQRKTTKRIKNKQKDILHKYSKVIVDKAIENGVGKIIIGDCSGTHVETNTGAQNQKIQQNPERKLAKYIQYKFERVGGQSEDVPENYTSRDCPKCETRKKNSPKGRIYKCKKCGFVFDRDGVGAVNITKNYIKRETKVSFGHSWLDVVGGLTPPMGVKYVPELSLYLLIQKGNFLKRKVKIINPKKLVAFAKSYDFAQAEEPHVL